MLKEDSAIIGNYYNPKMLSQSIVSFPNRVAKIDNIKLLDKQGNMVNVIQKGLFYQYTYQVKFFDNYTNITLGMQLRTKTGLPIAANAFEIADVGIESIKKDDVVVVSWEFKNLLSSGEYFFNTGVSQIRDNDRVFLHRILDGYMIKVLTNEKKDFALVDLLHNQKVKFI